MKKSPLGLVVLAAACLVTITLAIAPNSRADALPGPGPYLAPPPPPPPPAPPALYRGVPPAPPLNAPVDYHDDTAQSRLVSLQSALKISLDQLQQALVDPQGGFVESAIALLNQAQAETDQALAYLKTHPESDPLPAIPTRAGWPQVTLMGGFAGGRRGNVPSASPTLTTAVRGLSPVLGSFVIGPYPGISAIIGALGGNRDKIMKDISQAAADLSLGANALTRATNGTGTVARRGDSAAQPVASSITPPSNSPLPPPPLSSAPAAPAVTAPFYFVVAQPGATDAQPGSISGTVADTDGQAANALITLQFLNNVTSLPPAGSRLPAANTAASSFAATITDETGAFTITDLPPGFYGISASRTFGSGFSQNSPRETIEVKAGAATTLPAPILFR